MNTMTRTAGETAEKTTTTESHNPWKPLEKMLHYFSMVDLINCLEDVLWTYIEYNLNPNQCPNEEALIYTYRLRQLVKTLKLRDAQEGGTTEGDNPWKPLEKMLHYFSMVDLINCLEDVLWTYIEYNLDPSQGPEEGAWAHAYRLRQLVKTLKLIDAQETGVDYWN